MVAVEEAVCDETLDVVQDLLCEARDLGVEGKFEDAEILVGTQWFVISIGFDLLDCFTAEISQLFAFFRYRLTDFVETSHKELLVQYVVGA